MEKKKKRSYALEATLILLGIVAAFAFQHFVNKTNPEEEANQSNVGAHPMDSIIEPDVPDFYTEGLSDLGAIPDWSLLEPYQHTISKERFEHELLNVYSVQKSWYPWVEVQEERALIRMDAKDASKVYTLHFAKDANVADVPRYWRKKEEIDSDRTESPLSGVKIAIDPGHIGGDFAVIEERNFAYKETAPIQEGTSTMIVAKMLKQQLESLGATVFLTRQDNQPVSKHRSKDYIKYVQSKNSKLNILPSKKGIEHSSNLMFYRVGEIKQRARLVNNQFKPDLVVCLHFNATKWDEKNLIGEEHFHMILNGAYTKGEFANDDERFMLLRKILQGIHEEEAKLNASVARSFVVHTGLPPYQYDANSSRAVKINGNPYLWGRNLIANREFTCPVVYCEPYLMNAVDTHARISKGNTQELQYINGLLRPSIYEEYATSVAEGLVNYYKQVK